MPCDYNFNFIRRKFKFKLDLIRKISIKKKKLILPVQIYAMG